MIKKLLYILGMMMFISALTQPFTAMGENGDDQFSDKDVPYSSSRIFSKLTDALGLNPDLDWGESFGYDESDADKVGQNMYVVIYKKVLEDPAQKTMKDISGKYGMNEGDMWLVLNGDYTPIVDRKPGLTQEELLLKITEIQDEYQKERDLNNLEANIKAAVEPSEFFANGDVGDSGFDLMHDLQLIEEILFLKTSPIDIGKSYTSATGGGLSGTGQAPATSGEITGPSGNKTPATVSTTGGGGTETISEAGAGAESAGAYETRSGEAPFNPNACFVEDKYGAALNEFEQDLAKNPNLKDGSAGQQLYSGQGAAGGTGGAGGTGPGLTGLEAASADFLPAAVTPVVPVEPAPEDNWLKDKYCAGFFCLEINFVKEPAKSAFANSDNCIACHVEKINDVLKEVINHSLVPTKATGNLGESAECHNAMMTAFGSLSMNIYTVGMPIKTPINDDLMYGTDIGQEWENYCNRVAFFPFDLCAEDEKESIQDAADAAYESPPSLVNRATEQAVVQADEEATQAEILERTADIVQGAQEQQAEEKKKIESEKVISENAVLYHPLKYEVERMIDYFTTIRDTLHSLHEKVDGIPGKQACYDLKNKNECE